jgi:hypothetical protein
MMQNDIQKDVYVHNKFFDLVEKFFEFFEEVVFHQNILNKE